ncbi:MAG: FMNH2-dependent alkanesulfonate monooxygenase [bacterium]|nr:FMNH2-dependent alkanesulfonate monooxygenase [bacterium]
MGLDLFWFLPTGGDGRYLSSQEGARDASYGYIRQVAQAVDEVGFIGALLPTGRYCEEAWIFATSLVPVTQRMKFIVALRPGLAQPALAARFASTFDRVSGGRLVLNVVTGGSGLDAAADGALVDHDRRYDQTDEFLTIFRRLVSGEQNVSFDGEFFRIQNGLLAYPTVQKPYPPLYFGGSSDPGHRTAAKHADVYLMWGEPLHQIRDQIASVRRYADEQGRTIRFGLRLHVIVRETESEAWDAANTLIRYIDDDTIALAQTLLGATESVGQKRMLNLHGGQRDKLVVAPNLWAGIGLVRTGAGTALVGDPDQVAARLLEYAELGIDTFILSGYPHLEEAHRTAELLFPRLPLNPQAVQQKAETVTSFEFSAAAIVKQFGKAALGDAAPTNGKH